VIDSLALTSLSGVSITSPVDGQLLMYDGTNWVNQIVSGVPSGAVMSFASETAPTGWLKANGAAVSRTTYADLFGAIGTVFGAGDGSTTFLLPDMRGQFARGWDDGRGLDSSRAFGSTQSSENLSHRHITLVVTTANQAPNYGWTPVGRTYGNNQQWTASKVGYGNDGMAAQQNSGGTESRPRNLALLSCIKF